MQYITYITYAVIRYLTFEFWILEIHQNEWDKFFLFISVMNASRCAVAHIDYCLHCKKKVKKRPGPIETDRGTGVDNKGLIGVIDHLTFKCMLFHPASQKTQYNTS